MVSDEQIIAALDQTVWRGPKQLHKELGVSWQWLMRAMQRMEIQGKIVGRMDTLVVAKGRKKERKLYRLPAGRMHIEAFPDWAVPKVPAVAGYGKSWKEVA